MLNNNEYIMGGIYSTVAGVYRHVEHMINDGVWFDNPEIVAAAQVVNHDIIIAEKGRQIPIETFTEEPHTKSPIMIARFTRITIMLF